MKTVEAKKSTGDSSVSKPFLTWLEEAKELEQEDNREQAIAEYKKIIRAHPLREETYDRLMIILRKNKNIKEEIAVISKAIKTFENKYGKPSQNLKGKKVARLSNAILKSMGLADKKGHPIYEHQPVARWNKRKKSLESKLKNFPGE